jgi:hypothetical protein
MKRRLPTLTPKRPISCDVILFLPRCSGCLSSLILVFNMAAPAVFCGISWVCYLSLVTAGQEFMAYESDFFLLEVCIDYCRAVVRTVGVY